MAAHATIAKTSEKSSLDKVFKIDLYIIYEVLSGVFNF